MHKVPALHGPFSLLPYFVNTISGLIIFFCQLQHRTESIELNVVDGVTGGKIDELLRGSIGRIVW